MRASRRLFLVAVASALAGCAAAPEAPSGTWHAWLESPGGPLPFGLEFHAEGGSLGAVVINGPERLPVPRVEFSGSDLLMRFEHYDSEIRAVKDGDRLDGEWRRTSGPAGKEARLAFHAEAGESLRFPADGVPGNPTAIAGRWAVDFAEDADPSVGIFAADSTGTATGTFLNTTGDYRYLAGDFRGNRLRLSCFDGAHAFLFHARLVEAGQLEGEFWSRDTWHETWTAGIDPAAELPDAFALTRAESVELAALSFPDLEGVARSLDDPAFAGAARLIVVFGSWCPNCNDATDYLVDLHERYAGRGLSIVGLAFEMTGDFERDAAQVRAYRDYHDIDYPLLVAGTSDKAAASAALPLIDRVRAFPTTIFLDAAGEVRAVHQGFSGPATGPAYDALRERFESTIETLLGASAGVAG